MEPTQRWVDMWMRTYVSRLSVASRRQYEGAAANFAELAPTLEDFNGRVFRTYFRSMYATPTKANRWKAVLSSFCSWLVEEDLLDHNPVAGMKKFKEAPRNRFMTDRDLRDFAGALAGSSADPATIKCIKLLFSTGCRLGEAVGLLWEELHVQSDGSAEWHLPGDRNKSKRDFVTWVSPEMIAILRDGSELTLGSGRGRVFRSTASGRLRRDAIGRCMSRLCSRAEMPHFSPHDLRRTVGTHMARSGVVTDIRKAVLNHAAEGVTNVYYNQYDYWPEKVEALKDWRDVLIERGLI